MIHTVAPAFVFRMRCGILGSRCEVQPIFKLPSTPWRGSLFSITSEPRWP